HLIANGLAPLWCGVVCELFSVLRRITQLSNLESVNISVRLTLFCTQSVLPRVGDLLETQGELKWYERVHEAAR
ncbi:unnamed protein product, partial [Allacma fusca]